ncbi:MAG: hypothetical protein ABS948_11985 [Solibacillus sp.]
MTHFEYMEELGQINLFDVLEMQVGDQVRAVIYEDEMAYVVEARPYLLEPGEIVAIQNDLYHVAYGEVVEVFEKGKLVKV